MAASSSNSPCAACKFLRRKCTQRCVFAPYFPPDQPAKFAAVHRIFGASNVAKLLSELTSEQREDAVSSLAYEAEARLRDPVYGCVGYISVLQSRLKQLQDDLFRANKELSFYYAATRQSFTPTDQYIHGLHPEIATPPSLQILEAQGPTREPNEMLKRDLRWHSGGGFGGFSHPRDSGMPPSAVLFDEHPFRKEQHQQQELHLAEGKFSAGVGHAPPP